VQTGKITAENRIHDADIKDMQLSKDGTHFITASGDRTSKLVDSQDLQVMKEFAFERPANAAAMSPIADHVSHTPYAASLTPRHSLLVHAPVFEGTTVPWVLHSQWWWLLKCHAAATGQFLS